MNELTFLVYDGMWRSGGIQSIIIRLVERRQGQNLWAVCDSRSAVGLPQSCIIDISLALQSPLRQLDKGNIAKLTLIAFGPSGAATACLIEENIRRWHPETESAVAVVVLHPHEFMMKEEKRHVHLLNRLLGILLGTSQMVFMNEQCRVTHGVFFGRDLVANPIVPVPIDKREVCWIGRNELKPLRVVAVGRIVDFKAYNFALPAVVAKLNAKGHNVRCDIFGYGARERELLNAIEDAEAGHLVSFNGPIPLGDFDKVVSSYDLFVGMGTASMQAAQLGVPTILAIVDDPDGTHGFIQNAPFGNLGEQDGNVIRHGLGVMIETYLQATPAQRQLISDAGVTYANRYVVNNYVEQLTAHAVARTGMSRQLVAIYCRFYLWMAKDNWLRAVVRSVRTLGRKRRQQ